MFPFDELINYELCFPGAIFGSTEVNCPHCGELLTVPVDDPMGQDTFQCCTCGGNFDVNWGQATITPWISGNPELDVDVEED